MPFIKKLTRKQMWAALSGLLVIGLVIGFAFFTGTKTSNPLIKASLSPIEKVAPKDTGSLFMTPATKDWWGFISLMPVSSTGLVGLPFDEANAHPLRYAYATSLNTTKDFKNAGPLRIIYIETASPEDAQRGYDWLATKKTQLDDRQVAVKNNIIAISQGWTNQDDVFPKDTLQNNDTYTTNTKVANRDNTIGFGYIDFKSTMNALMNTKNPEAAKKLTDYFKLQFGIDIHNGSWVGHAAGANTAWVGETDHFNVDTNSINVDQARLTLLSFQTAASNGTGVEFVTQNENELSQGIAFNIKGKSSTVDTDNFNKSFEKYDTLFANAGISKDNAQVRGAIDLGIFTSVMSDVLKSQEGMRGVTFAMQDNKLVMAFLRNS